MKNLYEKNGLVFWLEKDIKLRNMIEGTITETLKNCLLSMNPAFSFHKVEAPILTPKSFINKNYTEDDYFSCQLNETEQYVLRPETTMGSYEAAKYLLSGYSKPKFKLPIVVYQHGKSFRKEQDQPTKFMRLKEFYQLEYQIIFSQTTAQDYSGAVISEIARKLSFFVGEVRVEPSDRIPDYSESTTDVVSNIQNMEVCSISKRKDFEGAKVLEVAIGTDRVVECHNRIFSE